MSDSATTLLEEFQKQKVSQESETLQSAQRFVNQYRSLKFLRESFVQEFNEQLLACPPDVRRFLPSIMGGNEVRNYLEFLEKQRPQNVNDTDETSQDKILTNGYLPDPESDLKGTDSDQISISRAEFDQMREQQKILMEQTQALIKRMNQQVVSSSGSSTMGRYSEIIDEES